MMGKKKDSTPRNHHYVPQVHIRRFKTDEGYHLYSKVKNEFFPATNSQSFFFEKDLNSDVDIEHNLVNHADFENKLTKKWDDLFGSQSDILEEFVRKSIKINYCDFNSIKDTLKFLFEYAIVAKFRAIKSLPSFNASFLTDMDLLIENEYLQDLFDKYDIKETLLKFKNAKLELKYPSMIPFEIPYIVPDEISCDIILAKESSFILPDCTCYFEISSETIKLGEYSLNKISGILLPLSPTICLQLKNNDVLKNQTSSNIYSLVKERVNELNKKLFKTAFSQVLTIEKSTIENVLI